MAPNYSLFYGVEGTTLAIAVICFSLRLSNRYLKKICTLVSVISSLALVFTNIDRTTLSSALQHAWQYL